MARPGWEAVAGKIGPKTSSSSLPQTSDPIFFVPAENFFVTYWDCWVIYVSRAMAGEFLWGDWWLSGYDFGMSGLG
jgi:hypothetical protein